MSESEESVVNTGIHGGAGLRRKDDLLGKELWSQHRVRLAQLGLLRE